MLISNWYHCSELTVHRKLNSSGCKIMLYTNFILMFQFLNVNIDLSYYHCWLHKSLYHTVLDSQSSEMHLNHLLYSLFPQQLLYSHKSALINMHHDEGSSKQTILWISSAITCVGGGSSPKRCLPRRSSRNLVKVSGFLSGLAQGLLVWSWQGFSTFLCFCLL